MPNTRDDWMGRVEKAVETLAEAAAMHAITVEDIVGMLQQRAQHYEGEVPQFMDTRDPMEQMPPDDFHMMKEQALQGRYGGY